MFAKKLLFALASAAAVKAVALDGRFSCGTPEPTEEQVAETMLLAAEEAEAAANGTALAKRQTITIETYVHVVASSTSVANGYLSDATINNQIAVMNAAFAPSGFQFSLAGIDKTVNANWASDGNELAMKTALRKGTYRSLNLYFLRSLGGNLGYCYFPVSNPNSGNNLIYDGCSILSSSVPGGSSTGYNLGQTATHEIGHWMNLYHTFQGNSCTGTGDLIADTPAQLSATSGCPTGRDSCPNQAGLDPIHNYMDYSTDACYEEFTAGQTARMQSAWTTFRAGK